MPDDRTPPRCEQTRPDDEGRGWRSLAWGTQSYPWLQPQTDSASTKKREDEEKKQVCKAAEILTKCTNGGLSWTSPDQEGTEEDEWDEVAVSEVGPTAAQVVRRRGEGRDGGVRFTLLTWQTWKHDLLPGLPCSTPGGLKTSIKTELMSN